MSGADVRAPTLEHFIALAGRRGAAPCRLRPARPRRPHLGRNPACPLAAAGSDRAGDRAHLRAAGLLPRRPRRPRRAALPHVQVPHPESRTPRIASGRTWARSSRAAPSWRSPGSAGCCARSTSTRCRSCGTSCAATWRWSGRGRSGRPSSPSSAEQIPQYWQRLVVRPGVTGFAQTRMTREESWADKLAHDMEYIADRSVSLYISVLLATVVKVAGPRPRRPRLTAGVPPCTAMRGIVADAWTDRLPPHVRDLRSRCAAGRCDLEAVRRMNSRLVAPRPRQRWPLPRRRRRAGDAAALDHRPRARRPADLQRGRQRHRRPERRDLQLPRAARRAGARAATASRTASDTEVLVHLYEEHGDALRRAPARDVRDRPLGRARAPPAPRPRPLRDQAALLPARRWHALLRLRAEGDAASSRASRARSTPAPSPPTSPSTRSRRR